MRKTIRNSTVFIFVLFNLISISAFTQTGTIKIFSEIKGISIYLDELFQGTDIIELDSVEIGTHYLKIMKDETIIFGELINVVKNSTSSVLIKDDEKYNNKMLSTKIEEQNQYLNNRLEIILSAGSKTFTKGASTLFPGYYSYWGYSNSVSTTVQTSDWKIIKGGVKEISELDFAHMTKNAELQNRINLQLRKEAKRTTIAAIIAIPCIITAGILLADMAGSKPFLHKDGTIPDWEAYVAAGSIAIGTVSYLTVMKKPYSGHYTNVEQAAKEAQQYNLKLKESLGLPADFEPNNK